MTPPFAICTVNSEVHLFHVFSNHSEPDQAGPFGQSFPGWQWCSTARTARWWSSVGCARQYHGRIKRILPSRTCSIPVGIVSLVWPPRSSHDSNVEDLPQAAAVEGVKTLAQLLGCGPDFRSIQQDCKDTKAESWCKVWVKIFRYASSRIMHLLAIPLRRRIFIPSCTLNFQNRRTGRRRRHYHAPPSCVWRGLSVCWILVFDKLIYSPRFSIEQVRRLQLCSPTAVHGREISFILCGTCSNTIQCLFPWGKNASCDADKISGVRDMVTPAASVILYWQQTSQRVGCLPTRKCHWA